jgi:hypothetical protein
MWQRDVFWRQAMLFLGNLIDLNLDLQSFTLKSSYGNRNRVRKPFALSPNLVHVALISNYLKEYPWEISGMAEPNS